MLSKWVAVEYLSKNGITMNVVKGKVTGISAEGGVVIKQANLDKIDVRLGDFGSEYFKSITVIDEDSDEYLELEAELNTSQFNDIVKRVAHAMRTSYHLEIKQLDLPIDEKEYIDRVLKYYKGE